MKNIIVCGDSFLSVYKKFQGTHFSELFSKSMGCELICYARPGMTNGGICVQIETAIRSKPDLILFNTTFPDRIEFAFDGIDKTPNRSDEDFHDFDISDIFYNDKIYQLSLLDRELDKNPIICAENLITCVNKPDRYKNSVKNWGDKETAIKHYVNFLHHSPWKERVDKLQLYATLHRLHLSEIPYIFCYDHVNMNDYHSLPWLDSKNDLRKEFNLIWQTFSKSIDRKANELPYHTGYKEQEQLFKILSKHYTSYFN